MKRLLLFILPLVSVLAGCKYDDTEVWDEIRAQNAKISALENSVSSINSNIGSLQSLVSAIQKNVSVTAVNKTESGYLISFSDGNTARITNGDDGKDGKDGKDGIDGKDGKDGKDGIDGKDGKDGETPQIGVKADADGNYYWTVNGKWLLDASGKKISTSHTPKVKIEDDQWMITYDDGTTWEKVEGQGPSATCVFETVSTDGNNALFTLSDGTVIKVPLTDSVQKLQLVFNETVFAKMRNGELLSTAYRITAPDGAKVALETFESDGWTVTIRPTDDRTGRISIKAPAKVTPSKILFLLTDDKGGSFVKIITIGLNESAKPTIQTEYSIDYQGGELIIPLVSSTAEIGEGGEWLNIVSVGDMVVLKVAANQTYDRREGKVTLEDGTVISVVQVTKDALILSKTVINIDGRRQKLAFVVNSNVLVTSNITEGSDWLSITPKTRGLSEKVFTFTAKRNNTDAERTAKVVFSGSGLSGTCTVNQAIYDGDPAMDVTEAIATDEGEAVELKTSQIVGWSTDGYVIADGGSYIFVNDAANAPKSMDHLGDSVRVSATITTLNGLPALGSVSDFTTTSTNNSFNFATKDITSKIDSYSSEIPTAVKVTGDLVIDDSGNHSLIVKGAKKKVNIYKPVAAANFATGYNITLTGFYYGEDGGDIQIITSFFKSNGPSLQDGDQATVAEFINYANTEVKLTLKGTVSNYNSSSCRFDLTDETGTIYVYSVDNKDEWAGTIKDGGTIVLKGKYLYYDNDDKHEVVEAEIISFNSSSGSTTTVYNYQKVTSVTDGKAYLIVAASGDDRFVAKPVAASKSYDWLYVDKMTETDGVISMPSKANEFILTSTDDGYTIKQSDGRLLYQAGTYNNFNVNESPSAGQYWNISGSDGTFTITNIAMSKYLQYAVSHNSFGSYADAQSNSIMPTLYEYIGESEVEGGGDTPGGDTPGGDTPGGDTPGGGSGSVISGNVESFDFSKQGYVNGTQYSSIQGTYFTATFGDGGNDGKYYDTGNAIRIYSNSQGDGYVQIASSKTITKIVYTFSEDSKNAYYPQTSKYSVNTGSLSPGLTSTWTGSSSSIKLTNTSKGQWRLQKIEITYVSL